MYSSKPSTNLQVTSFMKTDKVFCETDKDLCEKIRENLYGGPSIVFTRKAVVDKKIVNDLSTICKWIVGIDAS